MPTIGEAWPPDDPSPPLDYDHVGCCGPRDICGHLRPVELRVEVIGNRSVGAVGPGWLELATGLLMIAKSTDWGWYGAVWVSGFDDPFHPNFVSLEITHTLPKSMAASCQFDVGGGGVGELAGVLDNAAAYCSGELRIPVIAATGPADPPEEIIVRPLRWYQTSAYPPVP